MPGSLNVTFSRVDGAWLLTLRGTIDEDSEFEDLTKGLSGRIRYDLAGVASVNAFGMREWLNAMRELASRARLEFEAVSIPLVQQFNLLLNAHLAGHVRSFTAPYYCPSCKATREMLLVPGDHPELREPDRLGPPPQACPACKAPMDFDDDPRVYFRFLAHHLTRHI
jgi:hypothetical protein